MKKTNILIAFMAFALIIGNTACLKQKADLPPDASNFDPKLTVNYTILEVKTFHGGNALPVQIIEDKIISGIVTADDRGGNFYKQIMLQDASSGIALLIEKTGLFNEFPVGRKIYVNLKGLYVGEYSNFKQIGYAIDERGGLAGIPTALISKFIVKANYPNEVPIKSYSLFDLKNLVNNEAIVGTLIRIDSNAQFIDAEIGKTYAVPATISSGSDRTIEQCGASTQMVVRTSGYCRFQNDPIPEGRGSLVAIYSKYNSTPQLLVREISDVQMTNVVRCNGVVIQPGIPTTISALRQMYNGDMKLGNLQIHGTIISSAAVGTGGAYSYNVQDESNRGINLFMRSGQSYNVGDSITVDLENDSLVNYKTNILELTNGNGSNIIIKLIGSGKTVVPTIVTAADLSADLGNASLKDRIYESRLMKIINATLSSTSGNYGGLGNVNTLTDASGTITNYCPNIAPYNVTPVKTGTVSLTGVGANFYTTKQILIRSLSDIQ
jgi:Family of unknown function (DUF5689)